MNKQGILLVIIGSISYGIPASIFKLALHYDIAGANLLILQFVFAVMLLAIIKYFRQNKTAQPLPNKQRYQLVFSGLAIALSNIFYFSALQYVSVAVTAVMLMQSVWIAMIYGIFVKKSWPSRQQIFAVIGIMLGTILATNLLSKHQDISWLGIFLGLCSACSYAATIMITNNVASKAEPIQRAFYVSLGAACFITLFWIRHVDFHAPSSSFIWGALMACFAVVLPLLCFSNGMPKLSPSVGALISSLELPSAIIAAYLILNESISTSQALGILLILIAVAYPSIIKTHHEWHIRRHT